ncbi:MAG: tetratricopeptide repeat protein, partial [Myxococcota bacterium]
PNSGYTMFVRRQMAAAAALVAALSIFVDKAEAQPASDSPSAPDPAAQGVSSDERARQLFLDGDAMYAKGQYEQAIAAFSEAYELSGRHRILVALANSYERMARLEEAAATLRKYLPHAADDEAESIRGRISTLDQRVEEQRQRDAAAQAESERRSRELAEATEAAERAAARAEQAANQRDIEPPTRRPTAGWILAGAGGATLAAGVVFGVIASSARSDADDLCSDVSGSTVCTPDAESSIDRDKSFSLAADISFGVGAAAVAAGVILLLRGGGAGTSADSGPAARTGFEQPVVSIRPGVVEVGFAGRF